MTIDFEHVNTDVLQEVANNETPVHPAPVTVKMIQDKLAQKQFLHEKNLPVAEFSDVPTIEDAQKALADYDGKMLLKKRRHSYDGKGNAVVDGEENLEDAWNLLGGSELYAEKFVPFSSELAVLIARDVNGESITYPTVETIHVNNICHEVFLPGNIDSEIRAKAEQIAHKTAEHLDGAGVFAIEMFLTAEGDVLINEIAPRVHNSGHPTIEGSVTSQFEQHIRAITGDKLGSVDMKTPTAVMINILGQRNGESEPSGVEEAEGLGDVTVHLYGKHQTKVGRKMGHITATADTLEEANDKAEKAHSLVSI